MAHRQSQILDWNQDALSELMVFCIGCGGLGSRYLGQLARMGVGHLIFCDGDVVELSNLNRQQFYHHQLYQNKAVALYENLQQEATASTILEAYPLDFQDVMKENPDAFSGVDVLVCLVDNDETREEAARYGLAYGIPVIFSAVSRTALNGYTFVQQTSDGRSGCFRCISTNNPDRQAPAQCTEPSVVYIHGAVVSIAAYATTALAMKWQLKWNYYEIFLDSSSRTLVREKREDCRLCGGDGSWLR